jgi:hypothetical protein
MAIGLPFHDQSWSPADALPEGPPTVDGRSERAPGSPTEGAFDLGLVRAVIKDGLLMVFGPDGDPIPPEIFGAVAAEQPDAGIQLQGGPQVAAERVAAVLESQTRGQLGSGRDGVDDAWLEAMLGIGPRPEMADANDLLAEDCTVEVVAFDKELLITFPSGDTFLIAEARSQFPESICLRVAQEGPVALSNLVARLRAGPGGHRSEASAKRGEFAAPDCNAWIEGDELVIDLPTVGQVHLARSIGDVGTGALAGVFMSSGATATIQDLARALGQPSEPRTATAYDEVVAPVAAPPTRSVPLDLALPGAGAAGSDAVALVVVRGLPKTASLSAGVESGDGSWLLSPRNLVGLSLKVPPGLAADLPLEVVAISVASADGALTSASNTVVVPLRSAAVQVPPAPVPLGLDPQALSEGGPFDAVIVLDVPAGATLRPGTYDPLIDAWVLRPRQLAELSVLPASGQKQDFTLTLFGVRLHGSSREAPCILAQVPVSLR